MDTWTVIKPFSQKRKLRKRWKSADDFSLVASYDEARWFTHEKLKVEDLRGFGKALSTLQRDRRACLIHGRYLPDDVLSELGKDRDGEPRAIKYMNGTPGYRRSGIALREIAHNLLVVDVDGWELPERLRGGWLDSPGAFRESIREFVAAEFPPEWSELDFVAQATASAMRDPRMLRCRLFAWSDVPVTPSELKAFIRSLDGDWRDLSLYSTSQPIYTALPSFEEGGDPWFSSRLVGLRGMLGSLGGLPEVEGSPGPLSASRGRLGDPREDESLAGAFCRCRSVYEVLDDYLGDRYERVEEDRYLLLGSEERAGLIIYEEGLWAFSHHETDPLREMFVNGRGEPRPVNAFDLLVLSCDGDADKAAELAKDIEDVRLAVRGAFGEIDEIDESIARAMDIVKAIGPYEYDATAGQGWRYEERGVWVPFTERAFRSLARERRSDLESKEFEKAWTAVKDRVTLNHISWAGSDLVGLEDAAYRLNGWDAGDTVFYREEHRAANRLTTLRPWSMEEALDGAPVDWLQFLDEVFEGDVERVRDLRWWLGYNLIRDLRFHKIGVMVGASRSGKGVITRIMRGLLGDEGFVGVQMNSLASSPHITSLFASKLALVIGDAHSLGSKRDYQKVKEFLQAVSGGDAVEINPKNRPLYHEQLPCRVTIVANEMPRFPDASGALPNRYLVIPFDKSFAGIENPNLERELLRELPQIWRWALDGLVELGQNGGFEQSARGRELLSEMRETSNPVKSFIEACIEITGSEDDELSNVEIYSGYRRWCDEMGLRPRSQIAFGMSFKRVLREVSGGRLGPDMFRVKTQHPATGRRVDGVQGVRSPDSPDTVPTELDP